MIYTSVEGKQQNSGGNPYCPRETPPWQKEITNFFKTTPKELKNNTQVIFTTSM
jgi:hypothetical protein